MYRYAKQEMTDLCFTFSPLRPENIRKVTAVLLEVLLCVCVDLHLQVMCTCVGVCIHMYVIKLGKMG